MPGFVTTELGFEVTWPATVVLQVAVAGAGDEERLEILSGADRLEPTVVEAPVGGRQHLVRAPVGLLTVRYEAAVHPRSTPTAPAVTPAERIEALRPSRYCPSDRVLGLAGAQFAHLGSAAEKVRAICDLVGGRTRYTPGSSGPSTDGVETLLTGEGVCRDYAHAVAMLCRAVGVPARLAAVYAPGLSPMDMHAVVEAEIDGEWTVWDATRLAPRPSLVRIATGRDAADTAFVTVLDGHAELREMVVTAVAPGALPLDDHREVVTLG